MNANPNWLVLTSAAIGLIVNTLVLFTIAWKGGGVVSRLETTMQRLSLTQDKQDIILEKQGSQLGQHAEVLARTIQQLIELERRVGRLEGV